MPRNGLTKETVVAAAAELIECSGAADFSMRALMRGFVSQEKAGFFSHLPAQLEESFQTALRCYIDGLAQSEKRGRA